MIFKKKESKIIVKFRVSALFTDSSRGGGAFILKSGLIKSVGSPMGEYDCIVDFSDPVTWSKDITDGQMFIIEGISLEWVNEKLNRLMLDIMMNYERYYKNESIHPFYVITDHRYNNEKVCDMLFDLTTIGECSVDAFGLFGDISNQYLTELVTSDDGKGHIHCKVKCTKGTFSYISDEFFASLMMKELSNKIAGHPDKVKVKNSKNGKIKLVITSGNETDTSERQNV